MEMNLTKYILLGLATWRLTSLLFREVGPFDLFVRIREAVGIRHLKEDKTPYLYPDNFFGKLFECVWCLSVWIAFGMSILYIFLPEFAILFSLWLSLSTITIGLDKWLVVDNE